MNAADIVAVARGWLGTPYHHQAALKGVGCDCLGLVRGIYTELYGYTPEQPPPYSPDWAEASGRETMIEAARRHFLEIAPSDAKAGDVLVFRMRVGAVAKHCGIMSGGNALAGHTFIHAIEGATVSEVPLSSWWRRRISGAFRFVPVGTSVS